MVLFFLFFTGNKVSDLGSETFLTVSVSAVYNIINFAHILTRDYRYQFLNLFLLIPFIFVYRELFGSSFH